MNKFKLLIAVIVSLLPFNWWRVLAYKMIFGYKIDNSRIGFGTIIVVDKVIIKRSTIGKFNIFKGPFSILIEQNSTIGAFNNFKCGYWTENDQYKKFEYKKEIKIGRNVLITNNHHFDLTGFVEIGDNSWIAGKGSQFWTHGVGVVDRDIIIGKDCYIGSAVRFAPGSQIGDTTLVGIGSILTKKFSENHVLIAGSPAKIAKENFDWKKEKHKRLKELKIFNE